MRKTRKIYFSNIDIDECVPDGFLIKITDFLFVLAEWAQEISICGPKQVCTPTYDTKFVISSHI
jgi:hypothetical protein